MPAPVRGERLPDGSKVMGVVEQGDSQGLREVDPADRRVVDRGMTEDLLVLRPIEGPQKPVLLADLPRETQQGNRATVRVSGRPESADGVWKGGPGVDIIDDRLIGVMNSPPRHPGRDGPQKLVDPTEEVVDSRDMREVFPGRPFLGSGADPERQIVHGREVLEGGRELLVELQQVRLDGRGVYCRVGAFPDVGRP